jgi:hypothetical protein
LLSADPALAQGCGSTNPNCVVPTPPTSDNSNRAANTSWTQSLLSSLLASASVNFNSANTDTAITVRLPPGFSNYRVTAVVISGASASLSTATFGVFTSTGGGGTAIVSGGTAITVTATATATNNNMQSVSPNNTSTQSYNAATVYCRVGTAEGSAATGTVTLILNPVS